MARRLGRCLAINLLVVFVVGGGLAAVYMNAAMHWQTPPNQHRVTPALTWQQP